MQSEGAAVEADALIAAGAGEDGAHTWALECLAEGLHGDADDAAAGEGDARRVPGLHLGGATDADGAASEEGDAHSVPGPRLGGASGAAGEAGRGIAGGRRGWNGTESELAAAHGLPAAVLNGAGGHASAGGPGGRDAANARGSGAAEPTSAPAKRGRGRPRQVKVSVTA